MAPLSICLLATLPAGAQTISDTGVDDVPDITDQTDVRGIYGRDDLITLPAPGTGEPRPVRPELELPPPGTPVDVDADRILYDRETGIATALGNVAITYGPYVLNATKVIYDPRADRLQANGNVVFREPGGNILLADTIELRDRFREGFARHLELLLTNNSTITAEYAQRYEGSITVYERTTYTACQTCVLEGGRPVWQIKARQSIHDEKARTITHKDAEFELFGATVLKWPEITHADPTVRRLSGFLIPRIISSKDIGFGVEIPYFWALAPNYDITFLPALTTRQGPLLRGQWRHRLADGEYYVDAAGIYQLDTDLPAPGDRRFRGFVRTAGAFRLNQHWTWGWDGTVTTDDTFMRKYDIDDRTNIVNQIYMTGIKDRNYLDARAYNFRGLLENDSQEVTPYLAPQIRYSYTHDQPILGGEAGIYTNFYSLHREDPTIPFPTVNQASDATRIVTEAYWQRRMITGMGHVITPFTTVRGDVYTVHDLPNPGMPNGLTDDETTARLLPSAGIDLRWPFVRSDPFGQHVFAPVAQVIAAPNETDLSDISNEDAITLNFDHTNLFLHDRFTGYDRYEGGTRANLGFTYTLLTNSGGYAKLSVGQSFHLAGRNSFGPGSGLDGNSSDIVAAFAIQPASNLRATYAVRLDDETFDLRAQEFSMAASFDRLTAAVNYANVEAAPEYGRPDRVEQIWTTASLGLYERWRIFGGFRYDLSFDRQVRNVIGIGWDCDCMSVSLAYAEDFTKDRDVDPDRSILLSVSFRTLGGVKTSIGID